MTGSLNTVLRTGTRILTASALIVSGAVQGQSITKCQDSEGNWHYGDFAAEACAEDSTITEIDDRGVKVRETDAPPTEEELEARKAEEQAQQQEEEREAAQEREDRRLLQTYDSAQAIARARDAKVEALERDLESHRLFRRDLVEELQALRNSGENGERVANVEQQIQQYDRAIENLEAERQSTIQEYNAELERYRELTGE